MVLLFWERGVKRVNFVICELKLFEQLLLDGFFHDFQVVVVDCFVNVLVFFIIIEVVVVLLDESSLGLLEVLCGDQLCDCHEDSFVFIL
tara:strand:+ start:736 stop:1002 length:267 start_codon:yes stop_codon:yes gene_type:complete